MDYATRLQEICSLVPPRFEGNDLWDYVRFELTTLTRDLDQEIRQDDERKRLLVEQQEALDDQDRELAEKEQAVQTREQIAQTREHDLDRRERAVKDKEHQLELHAKLDLILEKMDNNATKEQVQSVSDSVQSIATQEQVTATQEQVKAVSKALDTVLNDSATKEQVTAVSNSLNTMSTQVQAIPGVSEKVDAISDQMKQVGLVSESLQNVAQFMEGVSHILHTVSGQLSQIWNDSSTKNLVLEMSSDMHSQNQTRSETLDLISSQISQVNNDKATREQVESALTTLGTLLETGATQELVQSLSTTVGLVLARFNKVVSKDNLKVLHRALALQLAAMANDHDIRLSDIESDLQNVWSWVENLCDGDTNSLAVVLKELETNKDRENASYGALARLDEQLKKVECLEQQLKDLKSTNLEMKKQIQDQRARLDKLNEEVSRSRELLATRRSCSKRSAPSKNNRQWVQCVDDLLDRFDRFVLADIQEGPLEAIFHQFCLIMSDPDVRALNNLNLFNVGAPVDRWYCFKRVIHSWPITDAIPNDGQCDMHDQCLQVKRVQQGLGHALVLR